ncbi:hypothetical protein CALCODRAFT_485655 [Calocera cornea HHB12733]|uniref:Uncharacterized protein n=1 Tax=Calocera cornea HHB12733 TaxID=1353952 RepID=A0A165CF41_9BASI|nr:hypothetical protein CALCODRAFT_488505 [Calocera cornea HHB12733]KZT54372.1 hypothetical protein CALCODRAFT_485655 [Calocera cornea HHB12733]
MKLQWKARSEITTANRAKHALAQARLLELEVVLNNTLNDIARETGISRTAIDGFFKGRRAGYKRTNEGVSLRNAAIHQLSEEHQERGEKFLFTVPESKDEIEDRMRWLEDNPTARVAAEQAIRDLRDLKSNQVRDTHQGRQVDTVAMQKLFDHETQAFSRRTNGHACGFVCRGSVADTAQPSFFGTTLSKSFFEDVLHVPAEELVFAYEAYCTSGGAKGASEKIAKRVINLKHSIRATLDAALQRASGDAGAKMQYKKFSQGVQDKYKVTLRGWPLDELQNPSDIASVLLLSRVHGALIKGACYFDKMTDTELADRARALEQELEQARERRVNAMELARAEGRPLKRRRLPPPLPVAQELVAAASVLSLPEPPDATTTPRAEEDGAASPHPPAVSDRVLDPASCARDLPLALVPWQVVGHERSSVSAATQDASPASGLDGQEEEVEDLLLDFTGQTPNMGLQTVWDPSTQGDELLPAIHAAEGQRGTGGSDQARDLDLDEVGHMHGNGSEERDEGDVSSRAGLDTLDLALDEAADSQAETTDIQGGRSGTVAKTGVQAKHGRAKRTKAKKASSGPEPKKRTKGKSARFDIDFAELDRERRAGAAPSRRKLAEVTNRGDGPMQRRSQRGGR